MNVSIGTRVPVSLEMTAQVIRCRCGDPDSHNGVRGPATVCPKGEAEAPFEVGYWHRSAFRRLAHAIARRLR